MGEQKLQVLRGTSCLLCKDGRPCTCFKADASSMEGEEPVELRKPSFSSLDDHIVEDPSRLMAQCRLYSMGPIGDLNPSKRKEYQLWRRLAPRLPGLDTPEGARWPATPSEYDYGFHGPSRSRTASAATEVAVDPAPLWQPPSPVQKLSGLPSAPKQPEPHCDRCAFLEARVAELEAQVKQLMHLSSHS